MTHTQAQGADGAETKTAGEIARDAFYSGRSELRWEQLAEASVEDWERAAAAVLASAPAATPGVLKLAGQLVDEIDGLIETTDGIAGLHRNGDLATWEELLPEGEYERLSSLDMIRDALAAANTSGATATPPGVPDSVRALSEAATQGDLNVSNIADGWRHTICAGPTWRVIAQFERQEDAEFFAAAGTRVRALIAAQPAGQSEDAAERCIACAEPLKAGERVLSDASGGIIHAACCGPERESYTGANDEALGPNDPIPQGYVYEGEQPTGQERPDRKWVCNGDPAQPAGQAGDAGAGWLPIETAPRDGSKFDAWAVDPSTGSMGVRFADVQMRGDGSGFGVVIHQGDAHWEYLERQGPTFPAWKLTHWRLAPAGPGKPAPNSTRTGAAETEDCPDVAYQRGKEDGYSEGVLDAAARAGLTLEYGVSSDPERHVPGPVEMLQRIAEHTDALAARPEAPSDAGWNFDMEAAPRDGTPINVGRDNGCGWDLLVVWWSKSATEYPWHTEGGGEYPEHRFDCWATLTPPSDPAPSGQAEG